MNQGPHSIYQCPGRYTLEVAEFSGRSTFDVNEAQASGLEILKRSPLASAAEDAERLAAALAKAPEIQSTRQPVYVYPRPDIEPGADRLVPGPERPGRGAVPRVPAAKRHRR